MNGFYFHRCSFWKSICFLLGLKECDSPFYCFTILESIVWIIDAKNLESDCINAPCRDGGEVVNEILSGMNGVMDVSHCISVDKDNILLVTCISYSFLFDIA